MFVSEKVEEIGRYAPWLFAILFIISINIPVFSYSAGEKEVLFFLASLDATSVSFTSGISVLLLSFAAISSPFFSYYSDNKVGKVLGISLSLVTLCFSIAILRAYAVYAGNLKLEETSFTGAIMLLLLLLLLLAIANLFYCFCFSLVSTRQKPKWHRVSPIKTPHSHPHGVPTMTADSKQDTSDFEPEKRAEDFFD